MMKSFHAKAQSFTQRRKEDLRLRWSLCLRMNLCAFVRNCSYVLIALSLITFSIIAQTPAEQRALLRGYIETGRYTEAEATAKRFLQKSPDAGPIHHELAEVLAITGRYTEAIA